MSLLLHQNLVIAWLDVGFGIFPWNLKITASVLFLLLVLLVKNSDAIIILYILCIA